MEYLPRLKWTDPALHGKEVAEFHTGAQCIRGRIAMLQALAFPLGRNMICHPMIQGKQKESVERQSETRLKESRARVCLDGLRPTEAFGIQLRLIFRGPAQGNPAEPTVSKTALRGNR